MSSRRTSKPLPSPKKAAASRACSPFAPTVRRLALETRILFDGAGAVAGVEAFADDPDQGAQAAHQPDVHEATIVASMQESPFTLFAPADDPSAEALLDALNDQAESGAGQNLLVIDIRVEGYQDILASLPSNVQVRVVEQGESGLEAVGQALAAGAGFDSVHIVSHGVPGALTLGSDTIDKALLASRADQVQAWAPYLTQEADILLYGCDIAQGRDGQAFIQELARLTSADIAASTDATGNAEKGGNWVLESTTGGIEAAAFSLTSFSGLLADTAISDSQTAIRVIPEDTETLITGITITDSDNPAQMTLHVQTTGGASSVSLAGSATITAGANGSADFTITGSLADIQATLNSLKYTPTENQNSLAPTFEPAITLTATDVTNSGNAATRVVALQVSAVNDNPSLATQAPLQVQEGGSQTFTLAQLAQSAHALDPDIATGQQQLGQLVIIIDSLPAQGTLTFNGGAVAVGMVIPVTDIDKLAYTHNGADVSATVTDVIGITVKDGGGGEIAGNLAVEISPRNVAPTISGQPSLIEGQVKAVGPVITLGDAADTWANSSVRITDVETGGQGRLFFDADGDGKFSAGDIEITGDQDHIFTAQQAALLSTRLMFEHNGAEPNAPGAVTPSYTIMVIDSGGGEVGAVNTTTSATIEITVMPNNDDPELSLNVHSDSASALPVREGEVYNLKDLLRATDQDIDPNNPGTPGSPNRTPANQIVYTVEERPAQGELQLYLPGSGLGANGSDWIILGVGGRFTQADLDAGYVRYYQTTDVHVDTADNFKFSVRDSAFGYDVWTDPANPVENREGGVRDSVTGAIAVKEFHFMVQAHNDDHDNDYTGLPRPPTPAVGGGDVEYSFDARQPTPGNKADGSNGQWHEDKLNGTLGYVITTEMLEYTITLKDATDPSKFHEIPPSETVYTLTRQPANGHLERWVDGAWQTLTDYSVFTQQDINEGKIRFVHDGGENHTADFAFVVSDGTANKSDGVFVIDVDPINDRPTAGAGSAQVDEGKDNAVYLGGAHVIMGDADGSLDPNKSVSGEGAQDFLWFKVTSLPAYGTLERWNGAAWVAVNVNDWLPSTLLQTGADGQDSGLRYRHDGTEPLVYPGGPFVTFSYVVRDDLANPGDPFATDATAPADASGSTESNQSAAGEVKINVIPFNDGPQVAQRPDLADPDITEKGTLSAGGATVGKNDVLTVDEGGNGSLQGLLVAVDSDNTTVQRQYRIMSTPTEGVLLLGGKALGVGSTFTQQDIDDGRVTYRHNGGEVGSLVDGNYHDRFSFVVSDGARQTEVSEFWITLTPTNDAPVVQVPGGPVRPDPSDGKNHIPNVSVSDPDLSDHVTPGVEEDFIQVTVRLKDESGAVLNAGVQISAGTPADSAGKWRKDGDGSALLVLQGTREQVNKALEGLVVSFADDVNKKYTLEVIADDRVRDGNGALEGGANGGQKNQAATPGGAPENIPNDNYNWSSDAVPDAHGNISVASVEIWSSKTNEAPVLTVPGTAEVHEDIRSRVPASGTPFVISDAESAAFDTDVTLTISIPAGQGSLHIGASGSAGSLGEVTIAGQGSSALTLTGKASAIQALMNKSGAEGGLYYTSAADVNHDMNGAAAGDVTVSFSLSEGNAATGSAIGEGTHAPVLGSIAVTIAPVNDAPTVSAGDGLVLLSPNGATEIPGFVVGDKDIRGDQSGNAEGDLDVNDGEKDFIQVIVRLQQNDGGTWAPLTDKNAYAGVAFGTNAEPASYAGLIIDAGHDGQGDVLVIRGSLDAVNAYLASLTVQVDGGSTLANTDKAYRVEVVADDRLRDSAGALAGGAEAGLANGGKNASGGSAVSVPVAPVDPYAAIPGGLSGNVSSAWREVFPTSVNDPASIAGTLGAATENSDGRVTLNGLTITDADALPGDTLSVTVELPPGFLIHGIGGSGGTIDAGGAGSHTVTFSGTLAEINSRLNAIQITLPDLSGAPDATDWNGSFDLKVTVDDKGNNGLRIGALPADDPGTRTSYRYADEAPGSTDARVITERVLTFTVNRQNDAPVVTPPADPGQLAGVTQGGAKDGHAGSVALEAMDEDSAGTNGGNGRTVADLFGNYFNDDKDQVEHAEGNGNSDGSDRDDFFGIAIVGLDNDTEQGVWQYYDTDGQAWVDIGDRNASNALVLSKDTQLRFKPAADFHGTPNQMAVRLVETDTNSDSATVDPAHKSTVNLSAAGAVGGTTLYSAGTILLETSVASVNDAPGLSGTKGHSTTEDTDSSALTASEILAGLTFNDSTDNQTAVTGGGNDASAAPKAIAIVGNGATAGQGTWYYTVDGGTNWVAVPVGVNNAAAIVLDPANPGHQVYFKPAENFNGSAGGLTIRAADGTYAGSAGGIVDISAAVGATHPWSATTGAVTMTVAPVNDAPVLGGTVLDAGTATLTEHDNGAGHESGTPQLQLLSGSSISDIDLSTTTALADNTSNFGAGSVTVGLSSGYQDADRLGLKSGYALPPGVTIDLTDNGDGRALKINFDHDTTVAEVQQVLNNLVFWNGSDDPTHGAAERVISYNVVVNDGNNAQSAVAGDNAGSGGAKDSNVLSGSFKLLAVNDPPVATNDTNGLTNTQTGITGNVIAGTHTNGSGAALTPQTPDSDPDTPLADLKVSRVEVTTVDHSPAAGQDIAKDLGGAAATLVGKYGTLTLNPDGSYSYAVDKNNPAVYGLAESATLSEVFEYTLSDGALTDSALLTITITGAQPAAPGIVPQDGNGAVAGHNTVHERGLTSEDDTSETVTGSIKVTAPGGIESVTIGGVEISVAALSAASSESPITITTDKGTLLVTGFTPDTGESASAPRSGTLHYSYTLTDRIDNGSAAPGVTATDATDTIALQVKDRADPQPVGGALLIHIVDDVPTASNDAATVDNDTNAVTSNALTNAAGGADVQGADGATITTVGSNNVPANLVADDGTTLTIQGEHGKLVLNKTTGAFTYTRDDGEPLTATDVFTYTLTDGDGDFDTATITISIADAPVSLGGLTAQVNGGDVVLNEKYLGNGSSPDAAQLTQGGTFTVNAPDGIQSLLVGGLAVIDNGVAHDFAADGPLSVKTPYGNTLTITGYESATGKVHYTYSQEQSQTHGHTVNVDGQGNSSVDGHGANDTFEVLEISLTDADGDNVKGELTARIIDDLPVAQADTGELTRGQPDAGGKRNTLSGNVYDNDSIGADGVGPGGLVTGVAAGTSAGDVMGKVGAGIDGKYGALVLNADGSYTYDLDGSDPAVAALLGNQTLTDTFSYTITDADGDTSTTTLTITIRGNTPPVAADDVRVTPEDTPVSGNVITGETDGDQRDGDADGNSLTLTQIVLDADGDGTPETYPINDTPIVVDIPGKGVLLIGKDGGYTFTPVPDWHGSVPPITYTVSDGRDGDDTATLSITVTPVADIAADADTTPAGRPVTTPVLANDDFEGSNPVVSVEPGDGPANGTVKVNPDGSITYTPNEKFVGTDTYTYTVTSGGVTETATVTIEVLNRPPVPQPDTHIVPEDTPARGNVLGNDGASPGGGPMDEDGHPFQVTGFDVDGKHYPPGSTVDIPGVGTFALDKDGNYTFTPVPDWNGKVPNVTYTVDDGYPGGQASATLDITVTPVADATPDARSTESSTPVTLSPLENDTFSNPDAKVTDVTQGKFGAVVLGPDGRITYTPQPGMSGTDTFTYTVISGGVTETTTVTIEVKPDNPVTPPQTPWMGVDTVRPDPRNPFANSVVGEPSVYFHGTVFERVPRMDLPFHPIVYVNREVERTQHLREQQDLRARGGMADLIETAQLESRLSSQRLAMAQTLYVHQELQRAQQLAVRWGALAEGDAQRGNLSGGELLPTPGLFGAHVNGLPALLERLRQSGGKAAAQAAERQGQTQAEPQDEGTPAGDSAASAAPSFAEADALVMPGEGYALASPSFSEQLRSGRGHLPGALHAPHEPV